MAPFCPLTLYMVACNFLAMSTVAEIEEAIAELPPEQWAEVRRWLDTHAPKVSHPARGRTQGEMEQWLVELSELRARTQTGKVGIPLQQLMDELREDRF